MLNFYSVRRHLSTDDYEKKFQTLLEKYVALPVVQKNSPVANWCGAHSPRHIARRFDIASGGCKIIP